MPYRAKHSVHELVSLFRAHQRSHLQHSQCQSGYNGRVFVQGLPQHSAVIFIVVQGSDFGDTAKALESSEVQFVYVGKMGIRNDDVG